MILELNKSSRHQKIAGDFGESLVLYWLSKYGFECAIVDHTGIDIIARNPHTDEKMGISVKSRSRKAGTEETSLDIPNRNFQKAEAACKAFGCVPYFALVIDAGDTIRAFLVSMEHLLEINPKGKRVVCWKMKKRNLKQYSSDPEIIGFIFKSKTTNWW